LNVTLMSAGWLSHQITSKQSAHLKEVPRFVYLLALSGEFGEIALMRMIKAIGCSSPARLCSGFLHGSHP